MTYENMLLKCFWLKVVTCENVLLICFRFKVVTYENILSRGDADKSLAGPGKKQATVTNLGIYSTYSPRSSAQYTS